jgi:hypothetical protein
MAHVNKAHTTVGRRLARRFGAVYCPDDGQPDIQSDRFVIEIETSATLPRSVARLESVRGRVYVAVTNREAIKLALEQVTHTRIGVMDPDGNIIRECDSTG